MKKYLRIGVLLIILFASLQFYFFIYRHYRNIYDHKKLNMAVSNMSMIRTYGWIKGKEKIVLLKTNGIFIAENLVLALTHTTSVRREEMVSTPFGLLSVKRNVTREKHFLGGNAQSATQVA